MPRKYLMSWDGEPNFRWVKMYSGIRYRVTCEELGATLPTKDGSYQLANAWWKRQKAELDGASAEQRLREKYKVVDLEERIRRAKAEIAASEKLLYELGYAPEVQKGQDLRSVRLRLDGHADLDAVSESLSKM